MNSEIIVRGHGKAGADPNSAVITVVVEGQAKTEDDAYAAAADKASQVDAVIAAHREAITNVSTASLSLQPRRKHKKGEWVDVGWTASRRTRLEIAGLDELGRIMASLASAGAAIEGPYWRIDRSNPGHSEARRRASAEARQRADDYASALGLEVTGVVWIAEPGLRLGPPAERSYGGGVDAMAMADTGPLRRRALEEIEVGTDELEVSATVEACFAVAPAVSQQK